MAIMSEKDMKRLNRMAEREKRKSEKRRKSRDRRIRFEVWSWRYERFFSFWRGALKAIVLTPITIALRIASGGMRIVASISSVGLLVSVFYFIHFFRTSQNEMPLLEVPELQKAIFWLVVPFVVYTIAIVMERFYWYLDAVRQAPPKKRKSVFDELHIVTQEEMNRI